MAALAGNLLLETVKQNLGLTKMAVLRGLLANHLLQNWGLDGHFEVLNWYTYTLIGSKVMTQMKKHAKTKKTQKSQKTSQKPGNGNIWVLCQTVIRQSSKR